MCKDFFLLFLLVLFSCNNNPTGTNNKSEQSDYIIIACIEGYKNGIYWIDPIKFNVTDSLLLENTPISTEFSEDYSTLYVSQNFSPAPFVWTYHLLFIDVSSRSLRDFIEIDGPGLAKSTKNNKLYSFGRDLLQEIDLSEKRIVHTDSLKVFDIVQFSNRNEIYGSFVFLEDKGLTGIFAYNTENYKIERIYNIDTSDLQGAMRANDLAISKSGDQLFITVYIYGIEQAFFYTVDVISGQILAKHHINGWSQLAVSDDNKYVYITDPGGYLDERVIPKGTLMRYNIQTRAIENYIDLKTYNISPSFNAWPAFYDILIFPDNHTAFISSPNTGADIMKWDLTKKSLLGKIALERGARTQQVQSISFGRSPE